MRKTIRIFGITILTIIGLHLIFGLYVWISNSMYLGSVDKKNIEYLDSNFSSSPNDSIGENLFEATFDKDFYNASIFLLGENHGFKDVQKIDLALLKHLHEKVGLRYYIAEMDCDLAEELNAFIQDSIRNESLLSYVVTQMKNRIPQQASQELYYKWSKLREFNLSLPDSLKINVIGIDKDFHDSQTQISRDSAMVKNLTQYIRENNLKNEKFYGLFGYFHTMQKEIGVNTAKPFAARLVSSNDTNIKKVKSIVVYHLDSDVYLPQNNQFPTPDSKVFKFLNDNGPITLVKGINDLKEVTKPNTVSIFNLHGVESPYKSSQNLAGMKVNFFGEDILPLNSKNSTVDYFQYVILGRNSKALSKFETNANNVYKK